MARHDPRTPRLHRLLRFLASLGVFQEGPHGWSLTPLGELLQSDVPGSIRAGARMMARMSPATTRIIDNVRTGTCAYSLAFGKPVFEDLAGKPEDAAIFDAAMKSFHGGETDAVLNAYSFDGVSVLADIGCGSGEVMAATLHRYPAIWQDDQCLTILGHVRTVIPTSGRLLIVETVVPEGNDPSPSKLFDMIMMVLPDGMERTAAEFDALLGKAGFRLTEITPTQSPVSVIEARPV